MNLTCAVLLVALVGSVIAFPQSQEPLVVLQDGTMLISNPPGPVPEELQQDAPVEQEVAPEAEPQNDVPAAAIDPVELAQINDQEATGEQAARAKRQFGFGGVGIGVGVGLVGGGFGGPGLYGGGYPGYGGHGGYGGGYGGYGGGHGGYGGGHGGYGGYGRRHHRRHHG